MVTVTVGTIGLTTAREAGPSTNTRPSKTSLIPMAVTSTGISTTTTTGTPTLKTIGGSTATGVIAAYSHRPNDNAKAPGNRVLFRTILDEANRIVRRF